jgi:hypothetical protein
MRRASSVHLAGLLSIVAACLCATALEGADELPSPYIKVEIRGELEHGIVAIGGESTGTVIHVRDVTWELDLGDNAALKEAAEMLHKKTVLVTGRYSRHKGVEIPDRHIVKVEMLKAAP